MFMNNFTKSSGRAYWHSITNSKSCSPGFRKLQNNGMKALLLLMFFTFSSGAMFAFDPIDAIDDCMHVYDEGTLPSQADAEATIDLTGCTILPADQIHLIPSKGSFDVEGESFPWGEPDDGTDDPDVGATGFDKTSTHCDWTFYYVFDIKCNNDVKRVTVTYHGGDKTPPVLKDKKNYPFPSDQKGLDLCYDKRPVAPSAMDIADLYTDNCNHVKVSDMVSKRTRVKNDDCGWIEIHTYTIKDYCDSNHFEMTLTYSGSDQSAPEFDNIPMDLVGDYAVQCDNIPPAQELNWSDNCTAPNKATAEDDDNHFDCSGGYILRTWNIVDACGNKNSHTQKIDVLPADPVKFDETPLHVYVPCADKADAAQYFPAELGYSNGHDKVDYVNPPNDDSDYHCLVSGSVKPVFTPIEESCGTFQVTYSYDDECNSIVKTVTVHIVDDILPTITTASDPKTVNCDGEGNLAELQAWLDSNGGATAQDNCDTDLTWTNDFNDRDVPVLCDIPGSHDNGSIFVVFTVTDDCGNESKTGNWFTIVDVTAPEMTPAEDYRAVCDGAGNTEQYERWIKDNGGATAKEECSNVTWTNNGPVLEEYVGNDGKKYKETLADHPEAFKGGCSTYTGNVVVTFTATDDCGNASSSTKTFYIEDSIAPVINTQAKDETVECDSTLPLFDLNYDMADTEGLDETQYHYSTNIYKLIMWLRNYGYAGDVDETCSNVTWSKELLDWDLTGCYGYITVRFTATDDCGNSSYTDATFRVEDTMSPVITQEAQDYDVECHLRDVPADAADAEGRLPFYYWLYRHGFSSAWDKCDKNLTWTNNWGDRKLSDECGATGAITVEFTVTDECGLSSTTSAEFRIRDTTAPQLDQLPTIDLDLDEYCMRDIDPGTYADPNVDVGFPYSSDNCGSVAVAWSDASNKTACTDTITRTWTSTDECGNVTTKLQTIRLHDNMAPVLVGNANTLNLSFYDACEAPAGPTLAQVEALFDDNCYTPIAKLVSTNVLKDDICGWSTQFEYTIEDRCGNMYPGFFKVLYFGSDQTAPVLDGTKPKGEENINMCYDDAVAAYLGETDFVDLADQFKDECDLAKLSVTRKFVDLRDWTKYPDGCTWAFAYDYKITDVCGNSYEFRQEFSGKDELAPRLNVGVDINALTQSGLDLCKSEAPALPTTAEIAALFTECGQSPNGVMVNGVDGGTNDPVQGFDVGADDCNWLFVYEYTITDKCGNVSPESPLKVSVSGSDQTTPVLYGARPLTVELDCDTSANQDSFNAWVANNGGAIATDNCDDQLTWSYEIITGKSVTFTCFINNVFEFITFTEVGTDLNGRVIYDTPVSTSTSNAVYSATYDGSQWNLHYTSVFGGSTYLLTTHPDDGLSLPCEPNGDNWTLEQTGCSIISSICDDGSVSDSCEDVTVVKFTATDDCNNSSYSSARFVIEDTTAPTAPAQADMFVTECLPAFDAEQVIGEADCNGVTVTENGLDDVIDNADLGANVVTYIRTYILTDACGNSSTVDQKIIVEDKTAPEMTCPSNENFGIVAVAPVLPETNPFTDCGNDYVTNDYSDQETHSHEAGNSVITIEIECNGGSLVTFTQTGTTGGGRAIYSSDNADYSLSYGSYFGRNGWLVNDLDPGFLEGPVVGFVWTNSLSAPCGNYRDSFLNRVCSRVNAVCGQTPGVGVTHHQIIRTFTATDDAGNTATCSTTYTWTQDPEDHTPPPAANPEGEDVTLNFRAYPVPFNGDVKLDYDFDFDTDVTVEVYDTKGLLVNREVKRGYKAGSKVTLPLSIRGADQLYYVKLITNKGTVTKKIVSSILKQRQ